MWNFLRFFSKKNNPPAAAQGGREFICGHLPVGCFTVGDMPVADGSYHYMPYSNAAHLGLIDQMRAQILPNAPVTLVFPAVVDAGLQPVKMAVHLGDIAHLAGGNQIAQGQEIAIPAPVVEYRQHRAAQPCVLGHPPRLGQRRGEWLVDHEMLAGIDRGHGVFGTGGCAACRRRGSR